MVSSESIATTSAIDGEMAALYVSDWDSGAHVQLAAEMVSRCSFLLAELEEFQSCLKEKKKDNIANVKGFKNDVLTELKRMKAVRKLETL